MFGRRAQAFHRVFLRKHWPALTGALLTFGNYSRRIRWGTFLFGTGSCRTAEPWQSLLSSSSRKDTKSTQKPLSKLLDNCSTIKNDISARLETLIDDYITNALSQQVFSWNYYLVKYAAMRKGESGRYLGDKNELGYRLCMLDKTQRNSAYRDAFLWALYEQSDDRVKNAIDEKSLWFTGQETASRLMKFKTSDISMQCVPEGFKVRGLDDAVHARILYEVASKYKIVKDHEDYILHVPKTPDASGLDAADRIVIGAAFLKDLVEAGLADDLHIDSATGAGSDQGSESSPQHLSVSETPQSCGMG